MKWDEGSYQLSHVWDRLLHTDDRHRKSVLVKASDVMLDYNDSSAVDITAKSHYDYDQLTTHNSSDKNN